MHPARVRFNRSQHTLAGYPRSAANLSVQSSAHWRQIKADKGPHAPVLAKINLCSDDLKPQLHTPRCVAPCLVALQDLLQSLLEKAVWGSSPTAEVPTH